MSKYQAQLYLGDLIGGSLLPKESLLIAELLLTYPTDQQWHQSVIDDNLLQKRSVHSVKRIAHTLRKRLEPLGELFWQQLLSVNEYQTNQLLLVAVLNNSPVLEDFIRIELTEAFRLFRNALTVDDWLSFYATRCRNLPALAQWSDSSVQKMGNNLYKILEEVELLRSTRSKQLQRIALLPTTQEWLQFIGKSDLFHFLGAQ